MTEEAVQAPEPPQEPRIDPLSLIQGTIDHSTIERFKRHVFRSLRQVESLRDWLQSPMAMGIQRGLVLWALGRHEDALPLLEEQRSNPAIACCIARSLMALGRPGDATAALTQKESDPVQTATWLYVLESQRDLESIGAALANHGDKLPAAEQRYFHGLVKELEHEPEAAIGFYDEALSMDPHHRSALFRLALNVDLRGEDEEARELYERALMIPPVNTACVVNLGILYEDMGNYRRAMQCFDLALQSDPEDKRTRMFRRDAAAALNMYYDEDQERREDKRNKVLRTPINDFELSVRSRNCLAKMNIRTLGDLVKKTEAELLSYKNFGETSLMEIKEILKNKGLRLGMTSDELMSKELGEPAEPALPPEEMPDPNSPDPARRPISELDLSVRSRRVVDLLKIKTIGDVANKTEAELLACPNFGQTSLNEIKTKLDELGLSLRG